MNRNLLASSPVQYCGAVSKGHSSKDTQRTASAESTRQCKTEDSVCTKHSIIVCVFFLSSGGWVKIKLKPPHFPRVRYLILFAIRQNAPTYGMVQWTSKYKVCKEWVKLINGLSWCELYLYIYIWARYDHTIILYLVLSKFFFFFLWPCIVGFREYVKRWPGVAGKQEIIQFPQEPGVAGM